jgi:CheY-like chemotaxis protein
MGRIVETHGFRVQLSRSGADALSWLAHADPPRLVLTDLIMPGMDGVELARRIHADWPHLPIVILTGHSADEVRSGWDVAPQTFLIQKPLAAEQLIDQLVSILR